MSHDNIFELIHPPCHLCKRIAEKKWAFEDGEQPVCNTHFEELTDITNRIKRKQRAKHLRTHRYERAESKVGRNDPCSCGSEKKFKKCCMNAEQDDLADDFALGQRLLGESNDEREVSDGEGSP